MEIKYEYQIKTDCLKCTKCGALLTNDHDRINLDRHTEHHHTHGQWNGSFLFPSKADEPKPM